MRTSISTCIALVAILPLRAGAQDDPDKKAAELSAPAVFDPTITSAASLPQPALVFRASTEEQSAALRIGKDFGNTPLGDFAAGATISGPLSKGKNSATLASLEGLTGATSLAAQVSLFNWRPTPADATQVKNVCQKYLSKDSCTRNSLPTEDAKKEMDDLIDYGHPWLFNGEFKLGRQSFEYIDPENLSAGEEAVTPWSLRIGTGFVKPGLGYIGVSYRYEHAFNGGEETEICTPLANTGALRCDTKTLGAPAKKSSNIGSIEARLFYRYFAVNPRAAYDFSNEVLGLELPIYFAQNGDSGFNAGVSIGWRSDDHKVSTVLFVGAALDLLPK
ncbi:hypothetical protein ACJ2CR_19360 [Myxococcus faecalis]|uniref:hypothetical protein n=1 Tax=Myxococcus faecalis TaxID=3115646 RepID=UPI0038D0FAE6